MTQPTDEQKDRNARREAELEWSLRHHSPTPDQVERIEGLRRAQAAYGSVLLALTLPGREQAVALTQFEDSCMWAVKSIVLERQ